MNASNKIDNIPGDAENYVLPLYLQVVWISMFLLISVIGTVGNLTVIWIVLTHRSMRTVANLFIVNLALSDAASALLNVPITAYGEVFLNWPFGAFYCKFNSGVASGAVCVSVMTLAVISIERYNAIVTPFKSRMRRRTAIMIIVLIWIMSLVIIIPHWYFVEIEEVVLMNESVTSCRTVWSKINYAELIKSTYSIFFMVLTYFLPLSCMIFAYSRVAIRLWSVEAIGEETEIHLKQKQAKQKVVKMLIVVVIVFALCWLPMHLYYIFTNSKLLDSDEVSNLFMVLFWLAMSNSMYNPIIYCWMNEKFRAGFKEAFRCCFCNLGDRNTGETATKLYIR